MRVALVSLDQLWQDKAGNIARCREFIAAAAKEGSQLVVFPEMTLTGYSLTESGVAEDEDCSETLAQFSELSGEYKTNVVFGLCLRRKKSCEHQLFNVLGHASPNGYVSALYEKFHPFTFAGEAKIVSSGEKLGFIEISGLTLGASICYDLRFPLLYAMMAPQISGALCIANWPKRRVAHWRSLLLARAIESQMFMIGVNRTGEDGNGLEYEKSSLVVSPDGEVLSPILASDELDIYDLDFNESALYRENFPTLRDAKFSRYAELIKQLAKRGYWDGNA